MDQATPNRQSSSRTSDYEIIFDTDDLSMYKIIKKYEQLEERINERSKNKANKAAAKNK